MRMNLWKAILFVGVTFPGSIEATDGILYDLSKFNKEYAYMSWLQQNADFSYSTNQTQYTAARKELVEEEFSNWMKKWKLWARYINISNFPITLQRAVSLISNGIVFFDPKEAKLASELKSEMASIYSSARIILPHNKGKATGEDEISKQMSSTKNPDILEQIWTSWRKELGEKIEPLFLQLVQLTNKASRDNGYSDVGEAWRLETGMDDVISVALGLWKQLEDFYRELHAYIRRKLLLYYGDQYIDEEGLLPVHLLGSVWGDNWESLYDIAKPYPESSALNITSEIISTNFTVRKMFSLAEKFYTSIGLDPMTSSFWAKSMFTKPSDGRLVDCHPAAYDFSLDDDYRIRICSEVNEKNLLRAIHEMGHVEYYMTYSIQPMVFRGGANSAFHEAVGETMAYSAYSPLCLQKLQLTTNFHMSPELSVNLLMKQALSKIASLPWALTVDLWRYMVFSGHATPEDMTQKWWLLREKFQGVKPPDEKAATLFDPGSKYHITNNMPYIRYYFSRFLEHQFQESLCDIAGNAHDEPLHTCCFLGSMEAGKRFKSMMSMGASQPWQDTLQLLTGKRDLTADAVLKYYQPLYEWLREYNRVNSIPTGW